MINVGRLVELCVIVLVWNLGTTTGTLENVIRGCYITVIRTLEMAGN